MKEDIEQYKSQGRRRNLVRVVGTPDEEGVSQVVDHSDQLADDGGDCQRGQRLGHRMDSKSSRFSFMTDSAPIPAECIEVVRRQMEQAAQFLPLAFGHAVEQQGFGAHGIAAQGFHQAASLFGDSNDALAVVIRGHGAADQPLGFQALGDAGNGGLGKMQVLDQTAGGDLLILRLPQDIEQGIALAGGRWNC